ncbi:MAG: hypothetical protein ACQEV0_04125 [Bacillota bacterium]
MKRHPKFFISFIILSTVFTVLFTIWSISKNQHSYEQPQEALLAEDGELVLIPAYKTQDEVLFFFMKNQYSLGAAMVYKNLFGWEADFLTWSTMNNITTEEKISGYQIHGGEIVFGLMKVGGEHVMMVDQVPAITINLELMLPDESENELLNGLYLWYYETHDLANPKRLSLVDLNTNEELDALHISN